MKNLIIIFTFFIISSCSSGLRINTKLCKSQGEWGRDFKAREQRFDIEGFGLRYASIRNLLRERDIKCEDINELSVSVDRDFFQALNTIIPNYSSQTVIIHYR